MVLPFFLMCFAVTKKSVPQKLRFVLGQNEKFKSAVPPGLMYKIHPLIAYTYMPTFVYGEPYSGAHTWNDLSACPQKPIRYCALYRAFTVRGSLEQAFNTYLLFLNGLLYNTTGQMVCQSVANEFTIG